MIESKDTSIQTEKKALKGNRLCKERKNSNIYVLIIIEK